MARGTNQLIIGITEDIPPDRWQQNLLAISEVIDEVSSAGGRCSKSRFGGQ